MGDQLAIEVQYARLTVELVRADMRAFVRPESFDLALSLFTSFGYFNDAEDDLRVLQNVHSVQGIHIPASGYGETHLMTHVTYDEIRTIYRQVADIVQGNRASYALRGNAYYDTPVGRLQFPVDLTH